MAGEPRRKIFLSAEVNEGMNQERFLAIKKIMRDNYKGPWVDDWSRAYAFVDMDESPKACEHGNVKELSNSVRVCVDCHVVMFEHI